MPEPERTSPGGIALVLGVTQFVLVMLVVQLFYPGYNDFLNPISDLGNSMLSSLAWLYNASIVSVGVAGLFATYFLAQSFPRSLGRLVGLGFLLAGNIGLILLGIFPENTNVLSGWAHALAGQVAFPGYAAALVAMVFAMHHVPQWKNHVWFTLTMGLVSLASVSLYGSNVYVALGPGGMERVFLATDLTWLFVVGVRLIRLPPGP